MCSIRICDLVRASLVQELTPPHLEEPLRCYRHSGEGNTRCECKESGLPGQNVTWSKAALGVRKKTRQETPKGAKLKKKKKTPFLGVFLRYKEKQTNIYEKTFWSSQKFSEF